MSCSGCKKNRDIKQEIYDSTKFVEKKAIWLLLLIIGFAIYGFYSLINLIILSL